MSETKTILMINAIVNKTHAEELPNYLGQVMQIFKSHGGNPIARFKTIGNLIGENSPEMTALIEFPSAETIEELTQGDEFLALSGLREKVFSKLNLLICNPM